MNINIQHIIYYLNLNSEINPKENYLYLYM
jgi:hypothetical protein